MRAILIAAKELVFAKTRFAPAIASAERVQLAKAMFLDVLSASLRTRSAEHVAVVSSDAALLQIAHDQGAITIEEKFPRGLNAAVRLATAALVAEGVTALCTVLSDVPLVAPEDIDEAFAIQRNIVRGTALEEQGPAVVLVPSRDLTGTNMIVRAPGDAIPTKFGSQSLARHREECRIRGLPYEVARMMRPAVDLDVMEDLVEFMRLSGATNTLDQLTRLGIAQG